MNATTDDTELLDKTRHYFDWLDYSLFGLMLGVSTLIGVYFGCFGGKQKKTVDYLLGGKNMAIFPVAVSLVASSISGVTVVGVPGEIFLYGSLYWLICVAIIFTGIIVNYVYLPVFFKLQLTSAYEYLELRFNKSIRTLASMMFTIYVLLYMPIVVYVPALALSQVSGLSIHVISPLVCIICIFYTMLGGMKAVIWTDFIQGFVIVGSGVVVIILGVINVGGFTTVWERSWEGGRIELTKFDPSPLNRDTVWTFMIGLTFMRVSIAGTNQGHLQKYLSLPDIKSAKRSLIIYVIGLIIMISISSFTGLLIYATYHDCDPLLTKVIHRPDQLLPYFVMETATGIPGLPGIFIAGIFSAALSTMSSTLNALSATIYEDLIHPCIRGGSMERYANPMMKIIVVVVGILCVLMVFVVEQLGAVVELCNSVDAITCGALLGLFSLGMFFPWANIKGAMVGTVTSMVLVGWLVTGAQNAMRNGQLKHPALPTSVAGCDFNVSIGPTTASVIEDPPEEAFILYKIAFQYFSVIGTLCVIIVGLIVSFITGPRDPDDMNRDLFVTFADKYVTFKKKNSREAVERELLNMEGTAPNY